MALQIRQAATQAIWRLVSSQHWVVARWQLLELGLSPEGIRHRLASGRLYRVHRGFTWWAVPR